MMPCFQTTKISTKQQFLLYTFVVKWIKMLFGGLHSEVRA